MNLRPQLKVKISMVNYLHCSISFLEHNDIMEMTAPPKVLHLEVYEIDSRTNPAIVHLRWQRLRPPLNGILHAYYIRSCSRNNNCNITEIQLDAVCDLWDNYICGSISRSYSDPQQTIEVRK